MRAPRNAASKRRCVSAGSNCSAFLLGGFMAHDPLAPDAPPFRFTTNYSLEFEPYYRVIGELAVTWAEFETHLNLAIWELANVSKMAGTCMTSQLIGPGPRFCCFVALLNLRETPSKIVGNVNALSQRAESVGRQRNRYLHDAIVLNLDNRAMYRMETTADRTVRHGMIPVSVDEISGLTGQIIAITEEFDALYEQVLADTPPWPRIQFERSVGIHRQRSGPESSRPLPEPPPQS
jgi:hypothetical protein